MWCKHKVLESTALAIVLWQGWSFDAPRKSSVEDWNWKKKKGGNKVKVKCWSRRFCLGRLGVGELEDWSGKNLWAKKKIKESFKGQVGGRGWANRAKFWRRRWGKKKGKVLKHSLGTSTTFKHHNLQVGEAERGKTTGGNKESFEGEKRRGVEAQP